MSIDISDINLTNGGVYTIQVYSPLNMEEIEKEDEK